jgi:hypothetical protein
MTLGDERLAGTPGPTGRRRPSRRLMWAALAVAGCLSLLAVLIVVIPAPGRPGERGKLSPQARSGPPPAPAGIVTVTSSAGAPVSLLAFHDPTTGRVTRTATAPAAGSTDRQHFSADFTVFVWTDLSGVHVAHLTKTGYVEVAYRTPSLNPDYTSQWEHAVVNPATGRVWFVERDTSVSRGGQSAMSIRVMSIDPNVAGDQPRVEQAEGRDTTPLFDAAGAPGQERNVKLAGDPTVHATLVTSNARVVSGTLTVPGNAKYDCPAPLDSATLICYPDVRRAPYGSVAELRFDPGSQQATIRQLLPTLDSPIQGLLVSPDRTQLRLRTQTGWLGVALSDAGTPQPVALQEPADVPLAWI